MPQKMAFVADLRRRRGGGDGAGAGAACGVGGAAIGSRAFTNWPAVGYRFTSPSESARMTFSSSGGVSRRIFDGGTTGVSSTCRIVSMIPRWLWNGGRPVTSS